MSVLITLILIAVLLTLLIAAYAVHVRQSAERHEEVMAAIDDLRAQMEREEAVRTGSGTGRHHLAEVTAQIPAVPAGDDADGPRHDGHDGVDWDEAKRALAESREMRREASLQ